MTPTHTMEVSAAVDQSEMPLPPLSPFFVSNYISKRFPSFALLSSKLFGLRAVDLLENTSAKLLKSKLSGYLIGSELAGAKSYWLGQNIVMIGNNDLCILYQKSLKKLGLNATIENTQNVTLYGLQEACRGRYNQ